MLTFLEWTDVRHQHVQFVQPALVIALLEAGGRKGTGAAEAQLVAVVGNGTPLHETPPVADVSAPIAKVFPVSRPGTVR
jgi:hypothetical protein